MAGFAGSTRKETLPPNWQALRAVVLGRAKNRCECRHASGRRCWDKAVAVDHIVPHAEGGGDELSNLQAICEWHHARKTGQEGRRGQQRAYDKTKKLLRREPEKSPGLIDPGAAVPRANRGF